MNVRYLLFYWAVTDATVLILKLLLHFLVGDTTAVSSGKHDPTNMTSTRNSAATTTPQGTTTTDSCSHYDGGRLELIGFDVDDATTDKDT